LAGALAGAVAVFATRNEAGSAALVTVGFFCLALAALWDRVKSFEAGGIKMELIEAVQRRLLAAGDAELRGNLVEASQLRTEAKQLLEFASPIAADYNQLRRTLSSGAERTALMERAAREARAQAAEAREAGHPLEPSAVRRLFRTGDPGNRLSALGYMLGDPMLIDPSIALGVIAASLSAFEQGEALNVARQLARSTDLDPDLSRQLQWTVQKALQSESLKDSKTRRAYASDVIAALQNGSRDDQRSSD
jgi:hypothetical protein